jgi:hypothetical protein
MLGPTVEGTDGVLAAGPGTRVSVLAPGVAQPGSVQAGAGVT